MQKSSVEALFSSINPDIVIHAAAVTTGSKDVIEKPYLHVTDNMIINSLIFEACHRYNVKHCLFFRDEKIKRSRFVSLLFTV
jgi:dTDP-4-dehydrorhamnose reductase